MSRTKVQRIELDMKELEEIVERASRGPLSEAEKNKLRAALETLAFVTQALEGKGTSIRRLKKMLFGASTEKTGKVLGTPPGGESEASDGAATTPDTDTGTGTDTSSHGAGGENSAGAGEQREKRKGHGRNGAASYGGAEIVKVAHESLESGDPCPECPKGKVYKQSAPALLVRVTGQAPLGAKVYELERFRCNLCLKVFTAQAPTGIGEEKYDAKASAMTALLKYGTGFPFNRLEQLQGGLGIPLPAATQWEIVSRAATSVEPAWAELMQQAAQAEVLHNDDTTAKILELMRARTKARAEDAPGKEDERERTGIFTSGIVALRDGVRIALFFTGRQHAGENLCDVLRRRATQLGPPIHMCDGLSRNVPGELAAIMANCIAHARRRFVDVVEDFPDECRYVLEALGDVYRTDADAKQRGLSAQQRLELHQAESKPVMDELAKWLREQIGEKKVEPNSGLGEAISYMRKHWEKLTLFLRVPGAPLDNNICERALKKAILHRKNALFFRTERGAHVGDVFMSLIHTAQMCGANPLDYLVALMQHRDEVRARPGEWMPWNYLATAAATPSP